VFRVEQRNPENQCPALYEERMYMRGTLAGNKPERKISFSNYRTLVTLVSL